MSIGKGKISERDFTDEVLKWAQTYGWRRFHVRGNTRRLIQGDIGFPDLVLVRPPRLIFAELKVGRNKPTPEQYAWVQALMDARAGSGLIEVHVWRPDDWSQILVALSHSGTPQVTLT